MTLFSTPVKTKKVSWNASFNLTIPKTKLVHFPGLASSSYANTYVIGEPLNLIYGYRYLGVDEKKGVFVYEDRNRDSAFSAIDRQPLGTTDPVYYGGLNNSVTVGKLQFDFFWQFTRQRGANFFYPMNSAPGSIRNMPSIVLQRWKQAGDRSTIQQFTQNASAGAAYDAFSILNQSDGIYSDASYARLKTLSLSYLFPENPIRRLHLNQCTAYISAQNLITITGYMGGDPETQNYLRLPPLKSVVIGLRLSF